MMACSCWCGHMRSCCSHLLLRRAAPLCLPESHRHQCSAPPPHPKGVPPSLLPFPHSPLPRVWAARCGCRSVWCSWRRGCWPGWVRVEGGRARGAVAGQAVLSKRCCGGPWLSGIAQGETGWACGIAETVSGIPRAGWPGYGPRNGIRLACARACGRWAAPGD